MLLGDIIYLIFYDYPLSQQSYFLDRFLVFFCHFCIDKSNQKLWLRKRAPPVGFTWTARSQIRNFYLVLRVFELRYSLYSREPKAKTKIPFRRGAVWVKPTKEAARVQPVKPFFGTFLWQQKGTRNLIVCFLCYICEYSFNILSINGVLFSELSNIWILIL